MLAFGPGSHCLEGEWHGTQTVLLEFESVEAAKEWYYSDAYQEAVKLRRPPRTATGSSSPVSDLAVAGVWTHGRGWSSGT